jgi:hypothetical protein
VQHADHAALDEQGHSQHRDEAALAEDRVDHVRVLEIEDRHGLPRRRDAPGEAASERDAYAALDLLLEPLGRAGHERGVVVLEQQDRRRVHA